jgi:hypothetical protein
MYKDTCYKCTISQHSMNVHTNVCSYRKYNFKKLLASALKLVFFIQTFSNIKIHEYCKELVTIFIDYKWYCFYLIIIAKIYIILNSNREIFTIIIITLYTIFKLYFKSLNKKKNIFSLIYMNNNL